MREACETPAHLRPGDCYWSSQGWQQWDGRDFQRVPSGGSHSQAAMLHALDLSPLGKHLAGRPTFNRISRPVAEARLEHQGKRVVVTRFGDGRCSVFRDNDTSGSVEITGDVVVWKDDRRVPLCRALFGPPASAIWDYYNNPPPKPPEEKTPIDKAIDEMMAKRKAKRKAKREAPIGTAGPFGPGTPEFEEFNRAQKEFRDGEALDRALSKAFVHHVAFADRILPYRVPG